MPDCRIAKEALFLEIANQHGLIKKLMKEKEDLTQRYKKGLQELNDNLQSDCKKDKEKLESDYKAKIEKHLKEIARLKGEKKVLKEAVLKLREEKRSSQQKIMEADAAIAANVSNKGTIKRHLEEIARLKGENEQLLNLPPRPNLAGGRKKKTRRKKTRRKRRKRITKRKSRSRRN